MIAEIGNFLLSCIGSQPRDRNEPINHHHVYKHGAKQVELSPAQTNFHTAPVECWSDDDSNIFDSYVFVEHPEHSDFASYYEPRRRGTPPPAK